MSGVMMSPAKATSEIRGKCGPELSLYLTGHAKDQMADRGLIMGDVLHVLKHGFVYESPEPSTREGCFKYKMECVTPNSNGRTLRVVLIPSQRSDVKIVTVMWVDEKS
jgi:hypothetical protein